jgi:hypothetical protein
VTDDEAQQWLDAVEAELCPTTVAEAEADEPFRFSAEEDRHARLLYAALRYWLARHPEYAALARYLDNPDAERPAWDPKPEIPRAFMYWVQRYTPAQMAELIKFSG